MRLARILAPASKLATARGLHEQTSSSSRLSRQAKIEDKLARATFRKDRWCSTMSAPITSKAVIVLRRAMDIRGISGLETCQSSSAC